MRAEVRSYDSPDSDDLVSYSNPNDSWSLLVTATIGERGGNAGDLFDFQVCSPQWMLEQRDLERGYFGRHIILMKEYNYLNMDRLIRDMVAKATGETWEELAQYIARFGAWEFEDYKPNQAD